MVMVNMVDKCFRCEHDILLHSPCTDIEGKINGNNITCNCNQTKLENDKQKLKIKNREKKH